MADRALGMAHVSDTQLRRLAASMPPAAPAEGVEDFRLTWADLMQVPVGPRPALQEGGRYLIEHGKGFMAEQETATLQRGVFRAGRTVFDPDSVRVLRRLA